MPLNRATSGLRTLLGWCWLTPVEWGIVALVAALLAWGALPRYRQWRHSRVLEEEQYAVTRVRAALTPVGRTQIACPAALDTCPDGTTAADCPFFGLILADPVRSAAWSKSDGAYRGPAGGRYRYEPRGCLFLQIEAPRDAGRGG